MHRLIAAAVATVALAACGSRPPVPQDQFSISETVTVSGSPDAIGDIERDLRGAIGDHRVAGAATVSINANSGPLAQTVQGDAAVLRAAFDDARRKAQALADAAHAKLGHVTAVDEVNAADNAPNYGGRDVGLKGVSASRVTLNGLGPEIVRLTFALAGAPGGPSSITVYGLQATRPPSRTGRPTAMQINVSAFGANGMTTVAAWESLVRGAARTHGVADTAVNVENVNANMVAGDRRPPLPLSR